MVRVMAAESAGSERLGLRICAVVVTYQPQPELLGRVLATLAAQVDQVLLLDNASPGGGGDRDDFAPVPRVGAGSTSDDRPGQVRRHRCRANRGLAWTQNLGARWAWRAGFDAILLMDQDSEPKPGMVAELAAVLMLPGSRAVAAVGPRPVDAFSKRVFPIIAVTGTPDRPSADTADTAACWSPCAFMIASGMLIPRAAWGAVGGMQAALFIDHVDTEWCLRARAAGWSLRIARQAHLEHRLGEGGHWLWIGRWRWFPHHRPLRHYYMVRNTIWLARRRSIDARVRAQLLFRAVSVVLFSLILLPLRAERLLWACRAARDALSGRLGPAQSGARQSRRVG
jgi:rhamnosyltransferase